MEDLKATLAIFYLLVSVPGPLIFYFVCRKFGGINSIATVVIFNQLITVQRSLFSLVVVTFAMVNTSGSVEPVLRM